VNDPPSRMLRAPSAAAIGASMFGTLLLHVCAPVVALSLTTKVAAFAGATTESADPPKVID